jgi:hypothetical protein
MKSKGNPQLRGFLKCFFICLTLGLMISSSMVINPPLALAMDSNRSSLLGRERFDGSPQQSKSGPVPPAIVVQRDEKKSADSIKDVGSEVVLTVPTYFWRHGCGPTALGMVVGFYDTRGFDDLVPGGAAIETGAVDQMIASGGSSGYPNPPGSEGNYEDYAMPEDYSLPPTPDAYITAGRTPHINNSLADYMDTSKSTRDNLYGWSWSNDMGPAFISYINQQHPAYAPAYQMYYNSTMSWNLLIAEIDAGRPMVFLVDTDGNNSSDHFVTVIGYRTSPTLQYASWDTWYSDIRWENFTYIANGIPWGIWGGWSFQLQIPLNVLSVEKYGGGDGSIKSEPVGIDCGLFCSAGFLNGTVVTLTAVPQTGSYFFGWVGGGCSGAGTCSITMDQAKGVRAVFYSNTFYTLSVSKTGTGSGTVTSSPAGITCGPVCSAIFLANTDVALNASPSPGSTFTGWSGAITSPDNPVAFTINGNMLITADFLSILRLIYLPLVFRP